MSAAKRDKRKKAKPRWSFGSTGGARRNPPLQPAHEDKPSYDANGKASGRSAHKDSRSERATASRLEKCVEDVAVDVKPGFHSLTDADEADVVRRVREFLLENGPSEDDDLLMALSRPLAQKVLSGYRTVFNFVDRFPVFHHVNEELHSFIYYEDPDDEEDDLHYPTPTVSQRGAHNTRPLSAAGKKTGRAQKPGQRKAADDGSRSRGAPARSHLSTSYESAEQNEVGVKGGKSVSHKDGPSQTPRKPHLWSRALQAVQLTHDAVAQTTSWHPDQFARLGDVGEEPKQGNL